MLFHEHHLFCSWIPNCKTSNYMAVTKLGFDEKCHNTSLLNDFHKKSTIRTMALGFASYIYITDMFMFINMFIGTLIFLWLFCMASRNWKAETEDCSYWVKELSSRKFKYSQKLRFWEVILICLHHKNFKRA